MKKFLLFMTFALAISFASCSSDDDGDGLSGNCVSLVQDLEDAFDAYSDDVTSVAKCNALKSALQDAIEGNCGTVQELEDAEDALALLTCDDLEVD